VSLPESDEAPGFGCLDLAGHGFFMTRDVAEKPLRESPHIFHHRKVCSLFEISRSRFLEKLQFSSGFGVRGGGRWRE
jgi:hypothetical protein